MTLRGKTAGIAAGLVALAALAGCDSSTPDQPAPVENAVNEEAPAEVVVPVEAPPPAETTNAATVDVEPRETPPDPDAQTLDDADATGMTARVRRDEAETNETVPQ